MEKKERVIKWFKIFGIVLACIVGFLAAFLCLGFIGIYVHTKFGGMGLFVLGVVGLSAFIALIIESENNS